MGCNGIAFPFSFENNASQHRPKGTCGKSQAALLYLVVGRTSRGQEFQVWAIQFLDQRSELTPFRCRLDRKWPLGVVSWQRDGIG